MEDDTLPAPADDSSSLHRLILIPEEPRIGEAGAQHPFVAGNDDGAIVFGLDISDHDEAGRLADQPYRLDPK